MTATRKKATKTNVQSQADQDQSFDNDVLFQRIFGKWYAFSVVDGECLMTPVPEESIQHFKNKPGIDPR